MAPRVLPPRRGYAQDMTPIAHIGHWSVSLVYLAPFLIVALWVLQDNLRRRRAASRETGEER
jgi:hypothetical protein